ncbi:hypothetical protein AAC387_Pa11g1115 [Persea americana]
MVASGWIKIKGANSAVIRARISTDNSTSSCIGSVIAKCGCWSFLKGGFVLQSSGFSILNFQSSREETIEILVASASLQPFTDQQWRMHQEYRINIKRKRAATIHVVDAMGQRVQGALITVRQISTNFPFGSAIAKTILGNARYQKWFVKRFNAAVFENELKWYATEHDQGKVNYTLADQLISFTRANQIRVRGHNIFWDDPMYTPGWVLNLTNAELHKATELRILSVVNRYKGEFIHWDVNNELLHFHFYEQRLGPDANLRFFERVQREDPRTTLFLNDFNVIETCDDLSSTVDAYISKVEELRRGGAAMGGIGLEGHFSKPNIPLMRAILDKMGRLGLPIWLTEIDINSNFDRHTQAAYLEEVLREGFSHPNVNGIMLWTALHRYGCYQMCLTDNNFHNLPAGDVVDKLLREWRTGVLRGKTDAHGSYTFDGFLGEYKVHVKHRNKFVRTTLFLQQGYETGHFYIQL